MAAAEKSKPAEKLRKRFMRQTTAVERHREKIRKLIDKVSDDKGDGSLKILKQDMRDYLVESGDAKK